MTEMQPSLFPESEPSAPIDMEAFAKAAAGAGDRRKFDPNDKKVSEAAIDQGWGPINPADLPIPVPKPPKGPVFEMPGRNRGRNNPWNQPMTRTKLLRGLSEKQIDEQHAINQRGRKMADAILRDLQDE